MELNATLIGQFITFAVFVWFTMKYVWPPIIKALQDRKQKIADGLAAAERGRHELEIAQLKATEILRDAKIQAAEIIDETNKRSNLMIEDAKAIARTESERIIALGKAEIERETEQAKQDLQKHIASIALDGAEKILDANMQPEVNQAIMAKLLTEI